MTLVPITIWLIRLDIICLKDLDCFLNNKVFFKNGDVLRADCQECICYNGDVLCSLTCQYDRETCLSQSNEYDVYVWSEPVNNQCCGKCEKQPGNISGRRSFNIY